MLVASKESVNSVVLAQHGCLRALATPVGDTFSSLSEAQHIQRFEWQRHHVTGEVCDEMSRVWL